LRVVSALAKARLLRMKTKERVTILMVVSPLTIFQDLKTRISQC